MKGKWILAIAVLTVTAVIASACAGIGGTIPSSGSGTSDVSATAAESTLSAVATSDYFASALLEVSSEQETASVTEEEAVSIDLSALTEESVIEGATYSNNVLTIKAAGTYILTGTLNGSVQVDKGVEGTVRIVLAGATVKTTDSQTSAAILFKQSDDLRILTVADGTVNEVSDSVGDTEAEGDGAAIQAKKSSLTINGSGTLKISAIGEDASGIKVKNELTILSAVLEVTAVKNGVKAGSLLEIKGATLTVAAGNDGIKTDLEPETEEEATAYAADSKAGYLYIEHSSLTITAGDDGIVANGCLYIANGDEDVITVTTNGGAPQTVTERSSDAAAGKAIKVSGIVLEDEEGNEKLYAASYQENYAIVITGGTFRLNSNDDAIHSKGNVLIAGGNLTIASGDDAIHAEYLTKIEGGTITVTKGCEGIEGAAVEITGGTISIKVNDDGVNAANSDLKNYNNYVLITGGDLTVDCSGDGLDSNGKLLISGGNVKVYGPVNGGNSALDGESGTTISGGTVIATCRESMDPIGSTQYMVTANVSVSAGTEVILKDSSGKEIVSFIAPKSCQNIIISTPDVKSGNYTLTYGSASVTLTAVTGTSGGMGFAGPMGGQGGMGQMPNGTQDGNPPALPNGEAPNGQMPQDGMTPPAMPGQGGGQTGGRPSRRLSTTQQAMPATGSPQDGGFPNGANGMTGFGEPGDYMVAPDSGRNDAFSFGGEQGEMPAIPQQSAFMR